jgi:hypothetical protein
MKELMNKCNFPKEWNYSNSVENLYEIYTKEEELKPYEKDTKEVVENHENSLDQIKKELLIDYTTSELKLEDLVKCYFRLMVFRKVCQEVVLFNTDLSDDKKIYDYSSVETKKEIYNEYMKKKFPSLFNNGVKIIDLILKCTGKLLEKMQHETFIKVLNELNIKLNKLPRKLRTILSKQYSDGLKECEGSRPYDYSSLEGDILQQVEEAIKVANEYADKYSIEK